MIFSLRLILLPRVMVPLSSIDAIADFNSDSDVGFSPSADTLIGGIKNNRHINNIIFDNVFSYLRTSHIVVIWNFERVHIARSISAKAFLPISQHSDKQGEREYLN